MIPDFVVRLNLLSNMGMCAVTSLAQRLSVIQETLI